MRLRTVLLAAAVGGAASYAALGRAPTWSPIPSRPAARHRSAYASALAEPETESTLLGKVVSEEAGLVVIQPEARAEAKIGTLVNFGSGASGVLLFERCGYYFATALSPGAVQLSDSVDLVGANLTIPGWSEGEGAWGGVYDYLNRPCNDAAAAGDPAADRDGVQVFAEPVAQAKRRPIGASLHTGVVAIDALTPIGRGQSMMLFGPDSLLESQPHVPPGGGAVRRRRSASDWRRGRQDEKILEPSNLFSLLLLFTRCGVVRPAFASAGLWNRSYLRSSPKVPSPRLPASNPDASQAMTRAQMEEARSRRRVSKFEYR